MAVGGEKLASETLEALQHYQGPLLEFFLTPRTSGLTYQEVVDRVQECHAHKWEALEGLIKVHGEVDKADKSARKSLKKGID